jgi:hypothetical protein
VFFDEKTTGGFQAAAPDDLAAWRMAADALLTNPAAPIAI